MGKRGKRYKHLKSNIKENKIYEIQEAIKQIKSESSVKFDETVDIAINLGIDPKQSDQVVRGIADLPHGTGKKLKIAVFAKDDKAKEAKDAGADIVGEADLGEKIEKNKIKVDIVSNPRYDGGSWKIWKNFRPKGFNA